MKPTILQDSLSKGMDSQNPSSLLKYSTALQEPTTYSKLISLKWNSSSYRFVLIFFVSFWGFVCSCDLSCYFLVRTVVLNFFRQQPFIFCLPILFSHLTLLL